MEDASFDFSVLDDGRRGNQTRRPATGTMRILIVAAHRDVLRAHLAALKGAGLSATAMDAAPLRSDARRTSGSGGWRPVGSRGDRIHRRRVDHRGGSPSGCAPLHPQPYRRRRQPHRDPSPTPCTWRWPRRSASSGVRGPGCAATCVKPAKPCRLELRDLAEDVRGTVDFFMAQTEGSTIDRLLITGGASQTEGLAAAIGGSVSASVMQVDPFSTLALDRGPGTGPGHHRAGRHRRYYRSGPGPVAVESPLIRLSVLPEEVAAAQRASPDHGSGGDRASPAWRRSWGGGSR